MARFITTITVTTDATDATDAHRDVVGMVNFARAELTRTGRVWAQAPTHTFEVGDTVEETVTEMETAQV